MVPLGKHSFLIGNDEVTLFFNPVEGVECFGNTLPPLRVEFRLLSTLYSYIRKKDGVPLDLPDYLCYLLDKTFSFSNLNKGWIVLWKRKRNQRR